MVEKGLFSKEKDLLTKVLAKGIFVRKIFVRLTLTEKGLLVRVLAKGVFAKRNVTKLFLVGESLLTGGVFSPFPEEGGCLTTRVFTKTDLAGFLL